MSSCEIRMTLNRSDSNRDDDKDFGRDVYCILGMPVDAIDMESVLRRIEKAAGRVERFLISTPNLNFLARSQTDREFRESLILSDLCPVDGMPILWVAKLLGIPITKRIAGADIFEELRANRNNRAPLRIFLFGGAQGAAAAACKTLNAEQGGLVCVGWFDPGFCSAEEMSTAEIVDAINASGAEFFMASLGAAKGQQWLRRNHRTLKIPVRVHLGAALNFQAGTVRRAPLVMRKTGLEWLWRIKEEPQLWRRYWNDGYTLLRLIFSRCIPIAVWSRWLTLQYGEQHLVATVTHSANTVKISLQGPAISTHQTHIISALEDATASNKQIVVDLKGTSLIDSRVLGIFLMLKKRLQAGGTCPTFEGASPRLKKLFHLNGAAFLLSAGE
jgi:N-acetylglucosaminyldiphosphoundecaprenol N-acetyl-beta-D-mannosaminyltransferase